MLRSRNYSVKQSLMAELWHHGLHMNTEGSDLADFGYMIAVLEVELELNFRGCH